MYTDLEKGIGNTYRYKTCAHTCHTHIVCILHIYLGVIHLELKISRHELYRIVNMHDIHFTYIMGVIFIQYFCTWTSR